MHKSGKKGRKVKDTSKMKEAQNRPDVKQRRSKALKGNRNDKGKRKDTSNYKGAKTHKKDCQCSFCKAKRGELSGKNSNFYGKPRAPHKKECTCSYCKAERGEYLGKNNLFYNKKHTVKARKGTSVGLLKYYETHDAPFKNQKHTEEAKRKQREATIAYAEKNGGRFWPNIGKNEKKILDNLEKEMGYKIDRKFRIEGYFPDGYIHELNLIIEVDERPKTKPKDLEREENIKKALNCEFLRIKDYNY